MQAFAVSEGVEAVDLSAVAIERLEAFAVSEEISALTHLRVLKCGGIREEEGWIGRDNMTPLRDLSAIISLSALKELDFGGTAVAKIPDLVCLPSLVSLRCDSTNIVSLEPLRDCKSLQSLDCSFTQITSLDPLRDCKSLHTLYCSFTQITDWHPALFRLSSLEHVIAKDARLYGLPDELLSVAPNENCLPRIRDFLNALEENKETARAVNVFLLGNGMAGKTSLANALRNRPVSAVHDSTHGMVLGDLDLQRSTVHTPIQFKLWDFGGQDLYHGAHSLFLKENALFLLCWTPREENMSVDGFSYASTNHPPDYWLAYARAHGIPDANILFLETKCDDGQPNSLLPDKADPRREHTDLKHLQVGSLVGDPNSAGYAPKGLDDLRDWLATTGRSVLDKDHVKALPTSWLNIRQALETERQHRQTLTIQEFEDIARRIGLEHGHKTLLHWLDSNSDVIRRPGHFEDRIIIDLNWALEAIYVLFDRTEIVPRLKESQGRFTQALLNDLVWSRQRFMPGRAALSENDQNLLLGFMLSSGMCFRHGSSWREDGVYIAPYFLPELIPIAAREIWAGRAPVASEAVGFPMLHDGIWRDITARLGGMAGADGFYWKAGVQIFDTETQCRARIERVMDADWSGRVLINVQRTSDGSDEQAAPALLQNLAGLVNDVARRAGIVVRQELIVDVDRDFNKASAVAPGRDTSELELHYVSYAWADDNTEEGTEREERVRAFMEEANRAYAGGRLNAKLLRDREDARTGDSIYEFMERLARGDRIYIFLSARYLESFFCMYELTRSWQYSSDQFRDAGRSGKTDSEVAEIHKKARAYMSRVKVYWLPCVKGLSDEVRKQIKDVWSRKARDINDEIEEVKSLQDLIPGDPADDIARLNKELTDLGVIVYNCRPALSAINDTVKAPNWEAFLEHGFGAYPSIDDTPIKN